LLVGEFLQLGRRRSIWQCVHFFAASVVVRLGDVVNRAELGIPAASGSWATPSAQFRGISLVIKSSSPFLGG
jgi:hypothetical protein